MMPDQEQELRKALTEVDLIPAYEEAVDTAIKKARQSWPDLMPEQQLRHARGVAARELLRQLGWAL